MLGQDATYLHAIQLNSSEADARDCLKPIGTLGSQIHHGLQRFVGEDAKSRNAFSSGFREPPRPQPWYTMQEDAAAKVADIRDVRGGSHGPLLEGLARDLELLGELYN
jgi:hypothetical protein